MNLCHSFKVNWKVTERGLKGIAMPLSHLSRPFSYRLVDWMAEVYPVERMYVIFLDLLTTCYFRKEKKVNNTKIVYFELHIQQVRVHVSITWSLLNLWSAARILCSVLVWYALCVTRINVEKCFENRPNNN